MFAMMRVVLMHGSQTEKSVLCMLWDSSGKSVTASGQYGWHEIPFNDSHQDITQAQDP